jgi:glucose/arabinose dehydrogenase
MTLALLGSLGLAGAPSAAGASTLQDVRCDPDDGGLQLPDGFCALVVATDVGRARHIVITPQGDIFIAQRGGRDASGGFLALRDTDGDGRMDVRERFGPSDGGTGMALSGDDLFIGTDVAVYRYRLDRNSLAPAGDGDLIVSGLPAGPYHRAKSIVVDDSWLFVNVGSPSNSCQEEDRTPGSPGLDPCPALEDYAGVWRFRADRPGQVSADGTRWATGMRNTVALTLNPIDGQLYGAIHGRDQLGQNWPQHYDDRQSATKPSEKFVLIQRGDDYGWPYCYHDPALGGYVLAPEYGGDGSSGDRCGDLAEPLLAFPAHWAPNAVLFYDAGQFPDPYRGGAFIAFHGSWNRSPLPQAGYNVVHVPFSDGRPSTEWSVFADGFAGEEVGPRQADHRPMGLALGPDGSLFITDDKGGTIWQVVYRR